jgi:hypothetical protein
MSDTDVQKALALLREAHDLLKESQVENLKKSASYLEESIVWLKKKHSEAADNTD